MFFSDFTTHPFLNIFLHFSELFLLYILFVLHLHFFGVTMRFVN